MSIISLAVGLVVVAVLTAIMILSGLSIGFSLTCGAGGAALVNFMWINDSD